MTRALLVRERAEDELMATEKGLLLLGPQLRLCSALPWHSASGARIERAPAQAALIWTTFIGEET